MPQQAEVSRMQMLLITHACLQQLQYYTSNTSDHNTYSRL